MVVQQRIEVERKNEEVEVKLIEEDQEDTLKF